MTNHIDVRWGKWAETSQFSGKESCNMSSKPVNCLSVYHNICLSKIQQIKTNDSPSFGELTWGLTSRYISRGQRGPVVNPLGINQYNVYIYIYVWYINIQTNYNHVLNNVIFTSAVCFLGSAGVEKLVELFRRVHVSKPCFWSMQLQVWRLLGRGNCKLLFRAVL